MTRARIVKRGVLGRLERTAQSPQAALKQVGALIVAQAQEAFKEQKLGNRAWPPRAEVNVFGIISDFHQGRTSPPQRRFETRPALIDTGRGAASISWRVVNSTTVEAGTNLDYMEVHQTGGETESKPITSQVQTLLGEWLQSQDLQMRRRLGFLLSPKRTDTTLKGEVPARPFLGLTPQLMRDIREVVKVSVVEAARGRG